VSDDIFLFEDAESEADAERRRERLARVAEARDRLEEYFPHQFLDPFEREVTWGIVNAGLELANAYEQGGSEGLSMQIEVTVIDERFEPFLEAIHRMLEWARSVVDGAGGEPLVRTVQESAANADPPLRFFRAVAGLLAVGIGEQLSAEELVGELAPVFREQTSILPSTPWSTHQITNAEIGPGDPLVYRDDSVGYQITDFGFREIQHSTRNPDLVYQLDEFLTLLECSLTTGRSRVIAQPLAPLTRERREKLLTRGMTVSHQYPAKHPFYFDEDAALLYIAAHTRLFEVWEVESGRRVHQESLPDRSYLIHPVRPGTVRISVRGSGLMEFDGTHLLPLEGVIRRDTEFVAAVPLRWNDHWVYTIASGLLFVADDGLASGVLEIPDASGDRVASACLLDNEIIVTTWNCRMHIYCGSGEPWDGWSAESRQLPSYVCVAPDEPWGVVFGHHTETTAWSGPCSYEIVDDVRDLDGPLARTNVVDEPGLIQIVAQPLSGGRLLIWRETHRSAAVDVGTREGVHTTMRGQSLPPFYGQALVSSDGTRVAFRDVSSPASLAVTDAKGQIIAQTEFPWVHTLISLDPKHETLTLRGREKTDNEQTTEEHDARPQLSVWSWHWPTDSWSSTPAVFHGFRKLPFHGRAEVLLYLAGSRDHVFLGVAGSQCLLLEERPEEELIIINDAIRRVNESTGEAQMHPLRPLLGGRTPDEITIDVSTAEDRAWTCEPGGLVNGYSLHDAKRLWRIKLPAVQPDERAPRLRLNRVLGMRTVLTLRTGDGRSVMIDAETGEIILELSFQGEPQHGGFLPVLTAEALLLPVATEIRAWGLSEAPRTRLLA